MPITYLKGDATRPKIDGPKIIAHICNDRGGFGKGFALAVANRWDAPKRYYKGWYSDKETFGLGKTQFVEVEPSLWVANMIAQKGYKSGSNPVPVQYEALRSCLFGVANEAGYRKASVHMPRIGCGLSGGSWTVVGPMVEEALNSLAVYVYDL